MDDRLEKTLQYAEAELKEIRVLIDQGKLNDKTAMIRMFLLGKVLIGWEDEQSEAEQVQYLLRTNHYVQETLEQALRGLS